MRTARQPHAAAAALESSPAAHWSRIHLPHCAAQAVCSCGPATTSPRGPDLSDATRTLRHRLPPGPAPAAAPPTAPAPLRCRTCPRLGRRARVRVVVRAGSIGSSSIQLASRHKARTDAILPVECHLCFCSSTGAGPTPPHTAALAAAAAAAQPTPGRTAPPTQQPLTTGAAPAGPGADPTGLLPAPPPAHPLGSARKHPLRPQAPPSPLRRVAARRARCRSTPRCCPRCPPRSPKSRCPCCRRCSAGPPAPAARRWRPAASGTRPAVGIGGRLSTAPVFMLS